MARVLLAPHGQRPDLWKKTGFSALYLLSRYSVEGRRERDPVFSRLQTLRRYSAKFRKLNQLFLGYFASTLRTVPPSARGSSATRTNVSRVRRGLGIKKGL